MTRWERPLLLFSIAINVAFASVAATNLARDRRDQRDAAPEPQSLRADAPRREWRRSERGIERRHAIRRERLGHVLDLDAEQAQHWDAGFTRLVPELRAARERVGVARSAYRDALLRADAGDARLAAHRVSLAQASVDSLCAEAMLAEAATLRPDQRARYVRWTLRGGGGGGLEPRGRHRGRR